MSAPAVPVLMYHSVAPDVASAPEGIRWLVHPLDLFDQQMSMLQREGWVTPTLDQLADHLAGKPGCELPRKSVVLTFDDGYLDNWVFVAPVLERYGLRGVVWVTKEFLEEEGEPRPTLKDVDAGRLTAADLQVWGYLNLAELKALNASGTLEVQSHNTTHTWVFTGPKVVDFHHPGSPHPWLAWNQEPSQKTQWLTHNQDDLVPWGTPIYENARAMARQYFPGPALADSLAAYVSAHGGRAFFENSDWRQQLQAVVDKHAPEGRYETDAEWEARIRSEVSDIKSYLSNACGIDIRHHCWPGGDYNDDTERIALDAGYATTTIRSERNTFGKTQARRVDRISIPYRPNLGALNSLYFKLRLQSYVGIEPTHSLHNALRTGRRLLRGVRS